jgi:guanylate kinase
VTFHLLRIANENAVCGARVQHAKLKHKAFLFIDGASKKRERERKNIATQSSNNNIMARMLHEEEQELEAVNRGTASF